MYSETVMDHFQSPRNVGKIENADCVGEASNIQCGDMVKLYLKIENDIVEDVKFQTFGCDVAIATSSMATELIKGKPIQEALKLANKAVAAVSDSLPPIKSCCSVLAEEALKAALVGYYQKNGRAIDFNMGCGGCGGCGGDCGGCRKS